MMRKNKLKFLSESVLLEESGLPLINTVVIVSITALILVFLFWANFVIMEENIKVNGQLVMNTTEGRFEVISKVGTQDVIAIEEGSKAYISIPGVTGRQSLQGIIGNINTEPKYDTNGNVFYYLQIALNKQSQNEFKEVLISGMESRIKIVTGSKSMLQYLLGNLYETGKDTFNIK